MIRGATVHSGPAVSAPIVRFYSVGTELELIDHQHGWFQVLDPATSQRGWIYEKYYLQAIRGPGQGIAVLQEPPKQKLVNARNSTPHVRRAKNSGPHRAKKLDRSSQALLATDTRLWPVYWTGPFDPSEASRTSVAIRSALHLLALQPRRPWKRTAPNGRISRQPRRPKDRLGRGWHDYFQFMARCMSSIISDLSGPERRGTG